MRGVYVHIPFCLRRCDYCDFTTFAGRDEAIPSYVRALSTHIRRVGPTVADTRFTSLFVGGGTPTYLPAQDLGAVLATLAESLRWAPEAEWTVEANPETVTAEMAATLAAGGVTRVSIGAQSFDHDVLRVLGRWHDPDSVAAAVTHLRDAGIDRLSVDLIYGTPGETDASWGRTLRAALDLGVTHVSAYALTVEPNTPYAARSRAEPSLLPEEDVQAERMAMAEAVLSGAGLARYEVSNWARPGHESRHNLTYWRGGEWLAFGSGAHGSWDGRRYWLLRDPERYAAAVGEGREPLGGQERPGADERRLERLMMGLRLVEGVERGAVAPLDPAVLTRLQRTGLVRIDGDRIAVTDRGRPLSGAIIAELA